MKKHWSTTPKLRCRKCKTVWAQDWTEHGQTDCPFCHAPAARQEILKKSFSVKR